MSPTFLLALLVCIALCGTETLAGWSAPLPVRTNVSRVCSRRTGSVATPSPTSNAHASPAAVAATSAIPAPTFRPDNRPGNDQCATIRCELSRAFAAALRFGSARLGLNAERGGNHVVQSQSSNNGTSEFARAQPGQVSAAPASASDDAAAAAIVATPSPTPNAHASPAAVAATSAIPAPTFRPDNRPGNDQCATIRCELSRAFAAALRFGSARLGLNAERGGNHVVQSQSSNNGTSEFARAQPGQVSAAPASASDDAAAAIADPRDAARCAESGVPRQLTGTDPPARRPRLRGNNHRQRPSAAVRRAIFPAPSADHSGGFAFTCAHIPGKNNIVADALSRGKRVTFSDIEGAAAQMHSMFRRGGSQQRLCGQLTREVKARSSTVSVRAPHKTHQPSCVV
jgi:hypothetical protein